MQGPADLEFHLPVKEFTKLVWNELTINLITEMSVSLYDNFVELF